MKKFIYLSQLLLVSMFSSSFVSFETSPLVLVSTKWISPLNDNCNQSLCFTSENTVMVYRCDDQWYYEVGYSIKGNTIEIEAYGNGSKEQTSKLILSEDNGVLRQVAGQVNAFPRNYILVPGGTCN